MIDEVVHVMMVVLYFAHVGVFACSLLFGKANPFLVKSGISLFTALIVGIFVTLAWSAPTLFDFFVCCWFVALWLVKWALLLTVNLKQARF